jgi:trimeric autotransporter adhesin
MRLNLVAFRWPLALFFGFLICMKVVAQPASVPDTNGWVPNGSVFAAVETNGVLYIGGSFSQIGPITGGFAAVDQSSGAAVPPFPLVGGAVSCTIADNLGGLYIGGHFNGVGGFAVTNLAHLGPNQTIDTNFIINTDGEVSALALHGNELFVGGSFANANGQGISFLAAIDTVAHQLIPFPITVDGQVRALAVVGNVLYLGGAFTHVGGLDRNYVAAVDLASRQVTSWNPSLDSRSGTGVALLLPADGRVYAAGDFTHIEGTARFTLAAFDASDGTLLPWDAQVSAPYTATGVGAVAVSSNAVFLGGNFQSLGGQPRSMIGAVDKTNGNALAWNPGIPSDLVNVLAVSGNTVYVGGSFTGIGANGPAQLAAVDATSGVPLADWVPAPGGPVSALFVTNGLVYVGGSFNSIGGVVRSTLGAISLTSGRATSWNPRMGAYFGTGAVYSLSLRNNTLYIGGFFYAIGGQSRNSLGAVNLPDASVLPFNPALGGSYKPYVFGIVPAGTNIIVTGSLPVGSPIVVDATTGQNANWSFGANGAVNSFAVSGTTLYVGGAFSTISGQPRSRLAAFDANTRQLLPWAPRTDNTVRLILSRDQSIIAVGSFLNANGESRSNLAVFDAVTGQLSLGPSALSANGTIRSLAASSNALYLTGDFTQVDGSNLNYFAAVDLVHGNIRPWNPNVSDVPTDLSIGWQSVVAPQDIVIAGQFGTAGGYLSPGMAVFPITNPPPLVQILTPTNQSIVHAPAQIPLQVQASSPAGIARTDVYVNTNLLVSFTNTPYSTNWVVPKHVGDYVVTAVAYDRLEEFSLSSASRVTVIPPVNYTPPSVAITFPSNNTTHAPYSTITVTTAIVAPSSAIESFQFLLGTNVVATLTQAPYQITLTNLSPGTYSVSAQLMDEYGIVATNGPVTFTINAPPQVTLQTPQNGVVIQPGGNLQLLATATDTNDSIAFVAFLSSGNVLGVATNVPYSLYWSNIPAGYYALEAIAQNSFGSRGTSAVANVTVSLVQNGGFESGDFTGWALVGSTPGSGGIYNGVMNSYWGLLNVHSGSYGAVLGDIQVASLSQTLSTVPGQYYLLSLWLDNPTSGTVQQFNVNWNTNSAATNTLFSIVNPPAFSWTNLQFLVIATGTNTILQIQAESDPNYFGLDDISVTPIPLPIFQTSAVSANSFQLSWFTAPGLVYQVQYKTNLLETNWINLTACVAETNYSSTVMDTNPVSSSLQRFYRLVVSP